MKHLLPYSFLILAAGFLPASCDPRSIAENQADVPQAAWHKDSTAHVTVAVTDTVSHCALLLTLRHSDEYPYNNIILSVTATAPSGVAVRDTVEYRLTDEHEQWLGKTGGQWIDHRLAFRTEVQFIQPGNFTFDIAHLMRRETLPGVGAVGIRIERIAYDY